MTGLQFHPLAGIFPLIDGADLDTLTADIQAHGLHEAITLHPDGSILDGRNRYRACLAAGVAPRFVTWNGDGSALDYVLSLNLHRRHLNESQRSIVAARIADMKRGDNQHAEISATSQTDAAELLNVSRGSVQNARAVLDHGTPELVSAVERGAVTVSLAASVAASDPASQLAVLDRIEAGERPAAAARAVHVSHNSGNNEWYTPDFVLDVARDVMGGIDCDPASSAIANARVGATTFYAADDDGLSQPWGPRVFLNPPYRQPAIEHFIGELARRVTRCEVREAVVIVNNGTETAWGQTLLAMSSAVCLLLGRVKFLNPHGDPTGAPLQGQMMCYVGPRPDAFARRCRDLGSCWVPGVSS